MTSDLKIVIRNALADARAAGKDELSQTEEAVRAVLKVRPDMTAPAALTAVELVRRVGERLDKVKGAKPRSV